MRRLFAALLIVAALAAAQEGRQPRVLEVFREFDRLAGQPLWPGFEPQNTAVEVFDGADTYLYHHPRPPEGFRALAAGIFVFSGQHESVRANTGTEVNGIPTATAEISRDSQRSNAELASLLIHETFHVYEKKAHPNWAANEAELFTYPLDDAGLLLQRRLETLALVRALQAKAAPDAACWTVAALLQRQERFAKMPPGAAAYERGIELNEGLAQYVEYQSIHRPAALTPDDFPLEQIRQRGYATGQVFALLLDHFAPPWKSQIGDTPLDSLLREHIPQAAGACAFSEQDAAAQREGAKREVKQLVASRAKRKQEFLDAPGWIITIVAGKEPLWPQGFDPWNVANLGNKEVLHSRWLKLGNSSGTIEVLNHASLTEAAGAHPLFNGVRKLIVTGLPQPKITEADGKVTVDVPGAHGSFAGAVERSGQTILIKLP